MLDDVTQLLYPGVYVLRYCGHVTWVGTAKVLGAKIYAHQRQLRGQKPIPGLPSYPIRFDQVQVRRCRIEQLDENFEEVCQLVGWRKAA
jgi:hypothetical protein